MWGMALTPLPVAVAHNILRAQRLLHVAALRPFVLLPSHTLRHSFAAHLQQPDTYIRYVQTLLGYEGSA